MNRYKSLVEYINEFDKKYNELCKQFQYTVSKVVAESFGRLLIEINKDTPIFEPVNNSEKVDKK